MFNVPLYAHRWFPDWTLNISSPDEEYVYFNESHSALYKIHFSSLSLIHKICFNIRKSHSIIYTELIPYEIFKNYKDVIMNKISHKVSQMTGWKHLDPISHDSIVLYQLDIIQQRDIKFKENKKILRESLIEKNCIKLLNCLNYLNNLNNLSKINKLFFEIIKYSQNDIELITFLYNFIIQYKNKEVSRIIMFGLICLTSEIIYNAKHICDIINSRVFDYLNLNNIELYNALYMLVNKYEKNRNNDLLFDKVSFIIDIIKERLSKDIILIDSIYNCDQSIYDCIFVNDIKFVKILLGLPFDLMRLNTEDIYLIPTRNGYSELLNILTTHESTRLNKIITFKTQTQTPTLIKLCDAIKLCECDYKNNKNNKNNRTT